MKKRQILPWKVLESTYLFKESWLTVRKDEVQLSNGNMIPKVLLGRNEVLQAIHAAALWKYFCEEQDHSCL